MLDIPLLVLAFVDVCAYVYILYRQKLLSFS